MALRGLFMTQLSFMSALSEAFLDRNDQLLIFFPGECIRLVHRTSGTSRSTIREVLIDLRRSALQVQYASARVVVVSRPS